MKRNLEPDQDAVDLAQAMVGKEAEDVHRNILSETLESAEDGEVTESGRTVCGKRAARTGSTKQPLKRYPTAVDLPGCPIARVSGIWHTHVTPDELRNPQHSLPDFANIVFGAVDASVVVGTDSAQVVVAATDRDLMHAEFENAIGTTVDGPDDVVDYVESGQITDYQKVRDAVTSAFDPLTDRVDLGYADIEEDLTALDEVLIPSAAAPAGCLCHTEESPSHAHAGEQRQQPVHGGAVLAGRPTAPVRASAAFRTRSRDAARDLSWVTSRLDGESVLLGTVVGEIVAQLVKHVLFSD